MVSPEAAASAYRTRYLASEQIYLAAIDPMPRADVIVDNNDLAQPRLIVVGSAGSGR
jgi:hypothetical protein